MNFRKICSIILSIIMIILGVYCIFTPDITYLSLAYIIGISILFDAIGKIVNWWHYRKENDLSDSWLLLSGILSCIFAVILLSDGLFQFALDMTIVYMIAIWILITGIIRIIRSFKIRKIYKKTDLIGRRWWIVLTFGIILSCVGILSLFNPMLLIVTIGINIGLAILISGCNMLTFALM